MKNTLKNKTKMVLSLFLAALLCAVLALSSLSADDGFESKIAAFPESYKPYLRQLHQAHPNWEFEPFFTYLDFNEAVNSECGVKSLVSSSASSDIFKSKDIGDYNYTTGAYIQKDSGFVEANRLAVAYFMDPRNFLNEDGIFMFETLSFNDSFTVAAVENVLKGSFMANTKITYYDSEGNLKKTSTKYSQAIFNAGKTYNVNPCFLASKILNEVGTSGSKSVTGTHSKYPGIYNFYNIGAYDGTNAIAKGLKWASEGTTYSRPWNTPVKSINGGAEFLAESYISCGQFTGYLQRFNVNPNNTRYEVYDHQYMTNLTGALSQGYSTYVSYVNSGLLENKYVFSIPVYENMPSQTSAVGDAQLVDGADQTGTISVATSFVRTGPSTYNAKLTDANGAEIKLSQGQVVTITDKINTDSDYYLSVLQYPYWYRVSFVLNGVTYEGYVPEGFVDVSTQIKVGIGEYSPGFLKTDTEIDMRLVSYDANIAQITENNTINFIKAGTVYIGAYDSLGRFDKVKYIVTKDASVVPTGLYLTDVKPSSALLNFTPSSSASTYEVIAIDSKGSVSHRAQITSSPYLVTGLNSGSNYNIFVRAILGNSTDKVYGPAAYISATTLPDNTVITKVSKDAKGNITIHWNALRGIGGYNVYTYDTVTKAYTQFDSLAPDASSYTIPAAQLSKNYFAVCAYGNVGGQTVYGKYSAVVDVRNIPGNVSGVNVTNVTKGGYTVTWNAVEGARYNLYKEIGGTYQLLRTFKNPKYKLKKAGYSAYSKYILAAYKSVSGIVYESVPTSEFSATSKPAAVRNLKISTTAVGGKLTWNVVNNATGYNVYIYKENKKKYVKLATVTKNKYTLKGRNPGKAFNVRVEAVINTTFGTYYGETAMVSFYTRPEKVSEIKATSLTTSSFTLSWEKTGGTSNYLVYQYNSKKKKYVKVATTTSTKYSASGLKAGTTYKFKIKSVKIIDGKTVSINTSSVFSTATKPSAVTNVTLSARKKTYLTLSWKKVTGVQKYQIFMYNSSKKKYVRIDTVENTTKYKVKGLKAGKTYYFKIKAVKVLGGKNYFGDFSKVFTFTTKS